MIIASAIKVNKDNEEFVIIGRRHWNCYETMAFAKIARPFKDEQGFVDHNFKFLTRKEAYDHVIECNQCVPEYHDCLYSEDIFPPKEGVNNED